VAQHVENGGDAWRRTTAPKDALDRKLRPVSSSDVSRAFQDATTSDPFDMDPQGTSWNDAFSDSYDVFR
jgi:hypothetical protein